MAPKLKIILLTPITLILILAIKLFIPAKENVKTKQEYFWTLKTHTPDKFDIIVMGDSRIYRGISPEDLTKKLPKTSAVNLGFSSAGFNDLYFSFAEEKLKKESKTKVILLGISPHSLTPSALKNEELKSYLNKSKTDVFKITKLANIYKTLNIITPSQISNNLTNTNKPYTNYNQEFYTNGWVKSSNKNPNINIALYKYQNIFNDNKVSEEAINNLSDQINKWTEKGIKVICFRPPSTVEMEQLEDSLSGYNEVEISQKIITNGGYWININSKNYVSYDGSHLHYQSAIKLSKKLGLDIERIIKQAK